MCLKVEVANSKLLSDTLADEKATLHMNDDLGPGTRGIAN